MIQSATLKDFIVELFRDYEANRQIKEPKWIKNWEAYKSPTIPPHHPSPKTSSK